MNKIGELGEKIAQQFLENKKYKILEKNFKVRPNFSPQQGEIDLIAKKDNKITFFEVKTQLIDNRSDYSNFPPEERVNFKKQRKIIKAAQYWLNQNKIPLDSKWQIDIIAIKINPNQNKAKIKHIQNL